MAQPSNGHYAKTAADRYEEPVNEDNRTQQPQVTVNGNLKLPDNVQTLTIHYMSPKMDDFTLHVKYLSSLIDSMARLALNTCITALTWMSVHAQMTTQNLDYCIKIQDTIKQISDYAKKYMLSQEPNSSRSTT
jgi:hypothetical protein